MHLAVSVPDGKEFPEIHTGNTLLDRNAVLRAWAVLLRCYTGTELVFFAELNDPHTVEANNERVGLDASSAGDAIRILQYQLSDSLELQRISQDDSHIHEDATTVTGGRIVNTAVRISRDFCAWSDADCRHTFSKSSVNLDQVGRLFSILIVSDSKRAFSLAQLVFLSLDSVGFRGSRNSVDNREYTPNELQYLCPRRISVRLIQWCSMIWS